MAKEASSSTGGTVGALVGAASGAASAFGVPFGLGGSLSYSYEDGFTGNLSYGKAIGNLNLGGSINFAEGHGITGYGLNTGLNVGKGPFDQLGLNLNYRADGSFVGGALSGSNKWGSQVKGAQGNYGLGLNFDAYGNTTGVSAKLDRKDHFGSYDMDTYHEAGVGLTMHMGGRTTLSLSSQAGQERNLDTGFYGWGAGVSGNFEFTPGGKLDGSSQSVDFLAKFQTEEQRDLRYNQYMEELIRVAPTLDGESYMEKVGEALRLAANLGYDDPDALSGLMTLSKGLAGNIIENREPNWEYGLHAGVPDEIKEAVEKLKDIYNEGQSGKPHEAYMSCEEGREECSGVLGKAWQWLKNGVTLKGFKTDEQLILEAMSRGQMDGIETLVKLGYNLSDDQMKAVRREYWNVTVESRERLQLGANERDLTEMPEYIDIMDKVLDMELRKSIFGGRLIQGARMANGYRGLYYRSTGNLSELAEQGLLAPLPADHEWNQRAVNGYERGQAHTYKESKQNGQFDLITGDAIGTPIAPQKPANCADPCYFKIVSAKNDGKAGNKIVIDYPVKSGNQTVMHSMTYSHLADAVPSTDMAKAWVSANADFRKTKQYEFGTPIGYVGYSGNQGLQVNITQARQQQTIKFDTHTHVSPAYGSNGSNAHKEECLTTEQREVLGFSAPGIRSCN